jgi:hypothetical protein
MLGLWVARSGRQRSNPLFDMGLHESRNERLNVLHVGNQSMPSTPIPRGAKRVVRLKVNPTKDRVNAKPNIECVSQGFLLED